MLFITNRMPKQSIRSPRRDRTRNFDFDLNHNGPGNSVFFCEQSRDEGGDHEYVELGGDSFLSRLRECGSRQILIYIHGFSNLPEDVFEAAQEFQDLCDQSKANEIQVVPLIWPCDNDLGIVKDYWDDQQAADASGYAFARVLEKFLDWRSDQKQNPADDPCLKRINVLAHSMGNRVYRETLANWNQYFLARGAPLLFRNSFLVAADIVNESLEEGERGEVISHASRNVVVYYASDDLALRASKVSNLKNRVASRRLGHTGPEDMAATPTNVYAVDCDDVNARYDRPKGHSYFRSGTSDGSPGIVFDHIFQTILSGRVFPADEFRRTTILKEG